MRKKELTILLSGDEFYPYQLQSILGYPVETLAERDVKAKTGKYKGQPSPYGMGIIRASEDLLIDELLNKWVEILYSRREEIKTLRIQEIEFMVQTGDIDFDEFSIAPGIIQKMAGIKARLKILKLD